jgi:polyisoprenoid-binding protein YceI
MTTMTETSTYTIDPVHSTAEFAVKHLMIATVKGRFRQLGGLIHIDEDVPQRSWVEAWIDAASVDTGIDMRDEDLRSENFLGATAFPRLSFKSTAVESLAEDTWRVHGDLTIREVTRPVVLETEFEGRGPDAEGKQRLGFTAHTTLSRRDFGLTYNPVLETGGVVVGDNIKVTLYVEAQREDSHLHVPRESK